MLTRCMARVDEASRALSRKLSDTSLRKKNCGKMLSPLNLYSGQVSKILCQDESTQNADACVRSGVEKSRGDLCIYTLWRGGRGEKVGTHLSHWMAELGGVQDEGIAATCAPIF